MITPQEIYTFLEPRISAASGLALYAGHFYIVSDDELGFVKLSQDRSSSEYFPLFSGTLPEGKKERKKEKPDLEGLTLLPDGSMLALPSGSKSNRVKGAMIKQDGSVQELMMDQNYLKLSSEISELNIEGAFVQNGELTLLQRGNGSSRYNALIKTDLKAFLENKMVEFKTYPMTLGDLKGIPLSFTDVTINGNEIWFLACAEATDSTYDDGAFGGAVIGKIVEDKIVYQEELKISSKPEGIAKQGDDFYIVTDDDDRSKPSKMFHFKLGAAYDSK